MEKSIKVHPMNLQFLGVLFLTYVPGWWFGTFFPYIIGIGNVIIPTVTHSIIFQRGRYTTKQIINHILTIY